jgi:hypothetical protein
VRRVDPLADQALRLADQLGVHLRKERRVVPDVVLHHEDDPHAHRRRVVRRVPPVLHELDDRHQDAGVPLPEEEAVDLGEVVRRLVVLSLVVVVGHRHHGDVEPRAAHLAHQLRGVHVGRAERRDDEVEPALGLRQGQGLGAARDVGQAGRVVERELEELPRDELVQAAVLLQGERVVEARHEQDVLDPERHQVLERLERVADVGDGGAPPDVGHGGSIVPREGARCKRERRAPGSPPPVAPLPLPARRDPGPSSRSRPSGSRRCSRRSADSPACRTARRYRSSSCGWRS